MRNDYQSFSVFSVEGIRASIAARPYCQHWRHRVPAVQHSGNSLIIPQVRILKAQGLLVITRKNLFFTNSVKTPTSPVRYELNSAHQIQTWNEPWRFLKHNTVRRHAGPVSLILFVPVLSKSRLLDSFPPSWLLGGWFFLCRFSPHYSITPSLFLS